jgi:uncharacterized SAM-binding protein YcdF (DUF218 family)
MFFILSKVLTFLISPLNLVVLLLLAAIGMKLYRRKLLISALVVFLVFSNPFILRVTVMWWEDKPVSLPVNDSSVKNIVVLGGMSSFDEASDRVRFWQSGDRLMQALMIWQNNTAEYLIVSGGSASIVLDERGEGAFLQEFLVGMGVDFNAVLVDSLSRNTYENAVNTAFLFDSNNLSRDIVLVTSAWHMPRARRCFEKQGFRVVPVGADPLYPFLPMVPADYIIPSAGVLSTWELLLKEWVGLVVYWLRGYI